MLNVQPGLGKKKGQREVHRTGFLPTESVPLNVDACLCFAILSTLETEEFCMHAVFKMTWKSLMEGKHLRAAPYSANCLCT